MIPFLDHHKKFLMEMAFHDVDLDKKNPKEWLTPKVLTSKQNQVSETDTHTIHKVETMDGVSYVAKSKKGGYVDASVNGKSDGKDFKIESMARRPKANLRMGDVLSHILKHHEESVSSDHFSSGGMGTFKKVARHPDVESVAHYPSIGKTVPTDDRHFTGTRHDSEPRIILRRKHGTE